LPFYVPIPKDELAEIWKRQRIISDSQPQANDGLNEDERVEDAGLDHDDVDDHASQEIRPRAAKRERALA
jgi:hypothetical protein